MIVSKEADLTVLIRETAATWIDLMVVRRILSGEAVGLATNPEWPENGG